MSKAAALKVIETSEPTNGGAETIGLSEPYIVRAAVKGVADFLFHRWNPEAVDAKAGAAKGSKAKKSDDIESYVYRNDSGGRPAMPFDLSPAETKPAFDLTTPRGRLLYLRDVVVPRIPLDQLDMDHIDCGTHACLCGWAMRDRNMIGAGILNYSYTQLSEEGFFFGLSTDQGYHLFLSTGYGTVHPTHAQLLANIDDVLSGRVK